MIFYRFPEVPLCSELPEFELANACRLLRRAELSRDFLFDELIKNAYSRAILALNYTVQFTCSCRLLLAQLSL